MTHHRRRLGLFLVVIAALASGGYALASTQPVANQYAPSVVCGASSGLASVRGVVPAGVQRVYLIYPNGASVQANVTRDAYVFIVPSPAQIGGWPAQLRYTQDNGTAHAIELPSGAFARCLATPQTRPATTADQPPTARRAVRPTASNGAEELREFVALSGVFAMPLANVPRTLRYRFSVDARIEIQGFLGPRGGENFGWDLAHAEVSFPTQADLDLYRSQPSLSPRGLALSPAIDVEANDLIGGPGSVEPLELATLPDTAAALLARLRADYLKPQPNWNHGHVSDRPPYSETQALWGGLKSILERSTNPGVMVAACQALASVPGIHVQGTARDARGRRGVAIIFTGTPGETDSVIVDQRTGQILQRTLTATRPQDGWPAGTVLTQDVWLSRSVTFSSHRSLPVSHF